MSSRRLSTILLTRSNLPCRQSTYSPRFFSSAATIESNDAPRVTTTHQKNGIVHVKLNRPNKLNALDTAMFEAIAETAESLAKDKSVRAVILSGEGKAFSTGLDVKSMARSNPIASAKHLLAKRHDDSMGNLAQDVAYLWRSVNAPVIAAIHGMCFGGGVQIALGADFRYCTPDAKVSIMEAKWGLIPDMSASVTLRELMPIDIAKELTMTGRIMSGQEAAELNLMTRAVEDPMAEAEKVANEIVQRNPDAVAAAKQLYQANWIQTPSEKECLKREMELQKTLLGSWNQMAAVVDNFGVSVPYFNRKEG